VAGSVFAGDFSCDIGTCQFITARRVLWRDIHQPEQGRWGEKFKLAKEVNYTMQETVTIPKAEYVLLKKQSKIDVGLLEQFLESFMDIKEGRVRRVK